MENFQELKENVKILLVDDDLDYLQVTAFFLKTKGYKVDVASSGVDAINKVKENNINIVLLDYYMPGLTGEDVVNKIREFNNKIIIILQTGFSGQQPPEETLARLDIQNYHDKSDGPEKLLLQVMSALRIFDQQTKVYLSEYRAKAIGSLIRGIAEELKSPVLSIGAGIEATKILVESSQNNVDKDLLQKINELYNGNKECLDKIDKVLSILILQSEMSSDVETIKIKDMLEVLEYLVMSPLKQHRIALNVSANEEWAEEYVSGKVSDLIFVMSELITKIVEVAKDGSSITLDINSTDSAWYISLKPDNSDIVNNINTYLVQSVLIALSKFNFQVLDGAYIIEIKK